MNEKEVSEKYKNQSIHYFENALSSIEAGDAEKAGEFLWGSMVEALKAVAAMKGIDLKSHRDIWDYARVLARDLHDRSIYDTFLKANSLHSNFYESELELIDVRMIADDVRGAVRKLLELVSA